MSKFTQVHTTDWYEGGLTPGVEDNQALSKKAFDPLTWEIIGAAIQVHKAWGPGFLEVVYQKSGDVLVELKAHSGIHDADIAQVVHYLRCSGLQRGLLLNFGLPVLQKRRVIVGYGESSVFSVGSVPADA